MTSIQLAKNCLLGITPKSAVFSVFDMLENREQSKMIANFQIGRKNGVNTRFLAPKVIAKNVENIRKSLTKSRKQQKIMLYC